MTCLWFWLTFGAKSCVTVALASSILSYELRVYRAGESVAFRVAPFPPSQVQCGQAPHPNWVAINPTHLFWDDPAHVGRACIWRVERYAPTLLPALPPGRYESSVVVMTSSGIVESLRDPFTIQTPWAVK